MKKSSIKKTRYRRQAYNGAKQISFLPKPEFNPKIPRKNTLPWIALSIMLQGKKTTHRSFDDKTESWRLAAVIHKLRKDFGWVIEEEDVSQHTKKKPRRRTISRYFLAPNIIRKFKENGGAL